MAAGDSLSNEGERPAAAVRRELVEGREEQAEVPGEAGRSG